MKRKTVKKLTKRIRKPWNNHRISHSVFIFIAILKKKELKKRYIIFRNKIPFNPTTTRPPWNIFFSLIIFYQTVKNIEANTWNPIFDRQRVGLYRKTRRWVSNSPDSHIIFCIAYEINCEFQYILYKILNGFLTRNWISAAFLDPTRFIDLKLLYWGRMYLSPTSFKQKKIGYIAAEPLENCAESGKTFLRNLRIITDSITSVILVFFSVCSSRELSMD